MKIFKKPAKFFWIANAVMALSLIVFFSRSLFTDRILAPPTFEAYPFFEGNPLLDKSSVHYLSDPIDQFIPWFHFNRQMLQTGKLPLWNPYQGCGVPHLANMQSSVFFPLNIFVYTLNWKWGLFFLYFFKLYFIGLFFYLYLMEIDTSFRVSIGMAVAGTFISYIIASLYNVIMNTAFFFPLGLWAIELMLKNNKHFKGYFISCIGFTFALLGGHPEFVYYSAFTLTIYFLIRLYQTYEFTSYKKYLPLLGKFFIIYIIGLLIAAIQLIPFLQYLQLSTARISRNIAGISLLNLPIYSFILSLLPPFTMKYLTLPATTSISIFLIALTGIITLKKDKIVRTFIVIAIVALCTGYNIPYIHSLITLIPGFNIGQNMYMGIFISWALLIISAKTLDNLTGDQIRLSFKIAAVIIFVLLITFGLLIIYKHNVFLTLSANPVISYLFQNYTRYIVISAIASIVILLLTTFILTNKNHILQIVLLVAFIYMQTAIPMALYRAPIKPKNFYPKNSIFSILLQQKMPFRITALPNNNEELVPYLANINTFYKLEDVRNYDALLVNRYNSMLPYIHEDDALNLTNVKYVIVKSGYNQSNLTNVFQPMEEYNGFILYKNLSAFDRAFMVYNYAIADGQQQALDLLHAYSKQLNKVAVVFQKDVQGIPFTSNTQRKYSIDFITYTPGYIKLSCTTSQPGLFFISDTYFPGWHARVDGKATKIIRTDYAFQGLWLTQGTHTIELTYDPASFQYGVLLSIIGIISLIGFYMMVFRGRNDN